MFGLSNILKSIDLEYLSIALCLDNESLEAIPASQSYSSNTFPSLNSHSFPNI